MAVFSGNGRNPFANCLDERLQVLERRVGEHAVPKVEDVAWAAGCLLTVGAMIGIDRVIG